MDLGGFRRFQGVQGLRGLAAGCGGMQRYDVPKESFLGSWMSKSPKPEAPMLLCCYPGRLWAKAVSRIQNASWLASWTWMLGFD